MRHREPGATPFELLAVLALAALVERHFLVSCVAGRRETMQSRREATHMAAVQQSTYGVFARLRDPLNDAKLRKSAQRTFRL